MIATLGWTSTDATTYTDCTLTRCNSTDGWAISSTTITSSDNAIDNFVKSDDELSLDRLKALMFVPRKIELKHKHYRKSHSIVIRNTLPRKIRIED